MNRPPNIVLAGFMGTGKTTVGEIVARRLKREFVDMDREIEARAGFPIAQIFRRQGEAAFRSMERKLARELLLQRGLVIATGGGALLEAEQRELFEREALVFCLNASKDELRERLADAFIRPLAGEWERLYDARLGSYASIQMQISTTGKTPTEIATEIIAVATGGLYVNTPDDGGYPIHIGQNILPAIAQDAASYGLSGHVIVLTNETIAPLYGEWLASALPNANLLTIPDGEEYKNLDTVRIIYEKMLLCGADRQSVLIALGGGVVGDTAGFAAATFMRGITFLQIPTTLLAMVDASVGGKVGVDMPHGKNLIGAFKQPRRVIIDTAVLDSLPEVEWRCGMAEVIKHGLLARTSLLEPSLWQPEYAAQLVREAVQVKIDIVQRDPYERGIRAHLNLGHTFAHAIEKATNYAVPHGEAVAIGLVKAAQLSRRLGMIDEDLVRRIRVLLWRLGLPTDIALDAQRWYDAMTTDKKWQNGRSRFVLLRGLNDATIVEGLRREEVMAVL